MCFAGISEAEPVTSWERERAVAERAAREAGRIVLRHYRGELAVREKARDNPVTDADLEADACIRALVRSAFPEDGWLSEETADSEDRLRRRRVWIVDPLDGTKEFIQKIPEFCVCVGLVEDGKPVLGACYNPARDELFSGIVGKDATLNGRAVCVSREADLHRARILASRTEDARGEWEAYKRRLRVFLTGSVAYKLALIAAGRGDATFSLSPKNEWDVCAGVALVLAAGGRVTDCRGRPLVFNRPTSSLPGLVASNGVLHEPILALLREETAP